MYRRANLLNEIHFADRMYDQGNKIDFEKFYDDDQQCLHEAVSSNNISRISKNLNFWKPKMLKQNVCLKDEKGCLQHHETEIQKLFQRRFENFGKDYESLEKNWDILENSGKFDKNFGKNFEN